MSSINFELCNDISCNDYDATAVLYVSLSTFRDIFKFETTEISNNALPATVLTQSSADITYYVNSSSFPVINPAHAMMDASGSEGITFTSPSSQSNLLKHDFIYYLGKIIIGDGRFIGVFNNIGTLKNKIEELGWVRKTITESILLTADNSGNGLQNTGTTPDYQNITKRILEQINYHQPSRLQTANPEQSNRIKNTTSIQSVPLIEGDSINYFWTLKNNNIADRKYRIKLHLTDNTSNINTVPSDSISNTTEYPDITSNGVPTF
jgi:hypothetical protein